MDTSSPEHVGAERVRTVRLQGVAPQPWRNGGGRTRELLAWPSAEAWSLRISVAEIEQDGPFSAFPGVQRWFAVIEGEGVALAFDGAERICRRGDAPLAFDGGAAPGCRLFDGPTRDLNLMARHGRATMRAVRADAPWDEAYAWRGLYTAVAGRWHDGAALRAVEAGTLMWLDGIDPAGRRTDGIRIADPADRNGHQATDAEPGHRSTAWRFTPSAVAAAASDAAVAAWWIGYNPDSKPKR